MRLISTSQLRLPRRGCNLSIGISDQPVGSRRMNLKGFCPLFLTSSSISRNLLDEFAADGVHDKFSELLLQRTVQVPQMPLCLVRPARIRHEARVHGQHVICLASTQCINSNRTGNEESACVGSRVFPRSCKSIDVH